MKTYKFVVDINAPQSKVWDTFFDLRGYGYWNPIIPEGRGTLEVGENLTLTWVRPRGKVIFNPKIEDIEKGRKMTFSTYLIHPSLVSMKHHFELDGQDQTRTLFTQRWECTGLLLPLIWNKLTPGFEEFKMMSLALKQHLED